MSVLMEFSIFPTDQGESVGAQVSEVIRMVRESGLDYRLTPMGTVVETETVAEALALVERAAAVLDDLGCRRAYSAIKLDIRPHQGQRMARKIESVEERIGEVKR
ncbi:MAG: MTH1187 family thiamine-binding protein [Thiohalocapsa sp.]|jgi:uncharacterized protein (TIGR00106 family)|uniref:MTH1187 family thiamine-binding protein n=1 Tax=Thiohalocapsa sp. TaxID=2497641 RepID=UPI0025D1FA9C|nr:MTH1187 family thiamine-binding protein [Thiohalocapsa sp.]MCG6943273.1 MTH1187 family thiamine-binding protein [Thiohalocapsa sp.]